MGADRNYHHFCNLRSDHPVFTSKRCKKNGSRRSESGPVLAEIGLFLPHRDHALPFSWLLVLGRCGNVKGDYCCLGAAGFMSKNATEIAELTLFLAIGIIADQRWCRD